MREVKPRTNTNLRGARGHVQLEVDDVVDAEARVRVAQRSFDAGKLQIEMSNKPIVVYENRTTCESGRADSGKADRGLSIELQQRQQQQRSPNAFIQRGKHKTPANQSQITDQGCAPHHGGDVERLELPVVGLFVPVGAR